MIDPKALDALYATLSDIEALNKPVEVTEEPKPVVSVKDMAKTNTEPLSSEKPDNLFNDFRNYLLSVLASNEQQQLDDTIASQVQPDPIPATPETVKNMVELERTLTGLTKATPTLLKEQIKNAIPVNLITQEELDKQTSMKQPQAKIEESLDFDAKEQPKAETTGTTYTSSSLYDGLKSKDETVREAANKYLYNNGITLTEWGGNKPRFDFVGYASGLDSSAFGPGQIVYTTAQKMLDKGFIKDKEAQNFAKKMIAAQRLFKNMYDNKRKFDAYKPEKASNTKNAPKYLKDLGITRDEFLEYTKQGYFYPSNSKEAEKRIANGIPEGIPLEILGDNYKENYFNLYKSIIKEKLPRTKDLDNLLQDYHGGSDEADKAYSKKTQGFLKLMEK